MLSVDIGNGTWNVYSFLESQRMQAVDQLQAYFRLTDTPCRWIAVVDVSGFRNPETLYGMSDPELYRRKEG